MNLAKRLVLPFLALSFHYRDTRMRVNCANPERNESAERKALDGRIMQAASCADQYVSRRTTFC